MQCNTSDAPNCLNVYRGYRKSHKLRVYDVIFTALSSLRRILNYLYRPFEKSDAMPTIICQPAYPAAVLSSRLFLLCLLLIMTLLRKEKLCPPKNIIPIMSKQLDYLKPLSAKAQRISVHFVENINWNTVFIVHEVHSGENYCN